MTAVSSTCGWPSGSCICSAPAPRPVFYEVDARLRPSGAAGMLVTTADAFADYQQNEARTWEHQALVRARVVYGDPALQARFDAIRRDILTTRGRAQPCRPRFARCAKMRAHLGNKHPNRFDIKADAGGITDIEFITSIWSYAMPATSRS